MNKFDRVCESAINESQPTKSLEFLDSLNTRLANMEETVDYYEDDTKEKAIAELAGKARQSMTFVVSDLEQLYKKYKIKV